MAVTAGYSALMQGQDQELSHISRGSDVDELPLDSREHIQDREQQNILVGHNAEDSTQHIVRETKRPADQKPRRQCTKPLQDWWPELLCVIAILLALLATVLTLVLHQGQPLPNWPFSISINALLSVYSVVLKSSILLIVSSGIGQLKWHWYKERRQLHDFERFDAASRGPLGAAKLLWAVKFSDITVSLAAVIVILALAVDPFAQQIVRYYSCDQPNTSAFAGIPRANSFELAGQHVAQYAASQTMDPGMLAAIANGFLDTTGRASVVPFTCGTGNCTFDNFQSIGLCTKCRDSTASVKSVCNTTNLSLVHNYTGTPLIIEGTLAPPQLISNGQPALITSNSLSSWSFDGIDVIGGINILALTNNNTGRAMPKMVPANGSSDYCSAQGVFAAECGLYPCISSYKTNITGGSLREDLMKTETLPAVKQTTTPWYPNFPGPACFGMLQPSCLTETQRRNLSSHEISISNTSNWIPFCNAAIYGISPDCYFELSQRSYYMLAGYFSSTLGSISGSSSQIFNGTVIAINTTDSWSTVSGSAFLQNLYQSGNITLASFSTQFNRMAGSMTAFMRQNGAPGTAQFARGKVLKTTTCVKVRWGWIALPAVLALFTSIFLIATMYISNNGFVWKTSSLAVLFHGLTLGKDDLNSDLNSNSAMEQTAKNTEAILDWTTVTLQLAPTKVTTRRVGSTSTR